MQGLMSQAASALRSAEQVRSPRPTDFVSVSGGLHA